MTRLRCFSVCACLALSLAAITCGSSNSGSGTPTTGWDQARIGNTGTNYEINAQKGAYFFAIQITPEDTTAHSTLVTLVQTEVAKVNSNPSATPLAMIPALSEIPGSGWSLDTTTDYQLPTGVDSASGTVAQVQAKATDLVDGGADPFFTSSYSATGMAWEDLTDGNYYMKVKIWNMGSAAAAKELYTGLLSDSYFSQDNNSWVTCTATACPTP
jgi:hypothetical protein